MPIPSPCPGPSFHRRALLQAGAISLIGLGLPKLLANPTVAAPKAKACILLFQWGGPSHIDTWDPKPNAPSSVRGEFKPISTTVPGIQISEHFPKLSRQAHRYAIIRSMTHTDVAHLSSVHHLQTGRLAPRVNSDADAPTRQDSPHLGSMLDHIAKRNQSMPTSVSIPWVVSHPAAPGGVAPGQHAGWLGSGFDPFLVNSDPNQPGFQVNGLHVGDNLTGRSTLLKQLDKRGPADFSASQAKAMSMLAGAGVERAFDLDLESSAMRDRYGRSTHGQCCLMARRLVESGTRLVTVNWPNDGASFWDTHGDNFNGLKNRLMPPADAGFSALLDDLDDRGLLEETLVVWIGEFGRAPKISNGTGREHHSKCYSAVLAGGGIRGGQVYGSSDRIGAYPLDKPTSPADITATIYHALGHDPHQMVNDRTGRPLALTEGEALTGLFV